MVSNYINFEQVYQKLKRKLNINIISNYFHTKFDKNALLIYITAPFYSKKISESHQNQWQAVQIAILLKKYKYNVDVIEYTDSKVRLKKTYDMVIGLIPRDIDIYTGHLRGDCIKIAYLTSSNLRYTNEQELSRILDLEKRKGVKLKPRRQSGYISKAIESFDAAFFIGNEFGFKSYSEFNMPPVFYIKNTGYNFDFKPDYNKKNPKAFLFFGSVGQVHKGLDLLLEVFTESAKDLELYICGNVVSEEDFCDLYHKELYETSNIKTVGFVDIRSRVFQNLTDYCAYTILPSCAEGCAGSILTVMSVGVIPIVSKMCGFDADEAILLDDCSKDCISRTIRSYSNKDIEWIKDKSKYVIEVVKSHHSRKAFISSFDNALNQTLKLKEKSK